MAHSTTARLRHQIFRLNQGEQADLDFGLGEILPPEDLALILTEEGATWKTIIYTPLLTTWAFLWQMLSPDRSCRAAVKRIAAWLSLPGQETRQRQRRPVHQGAAATARNGAAAADEAHRSALS